MQTLTTHEALKVWHKKSWPRMGWLEGFATVRCAQWNQTWLLGLLLSWVLHKFVRQANNKWAVRDSRSTNFLHRGTVWLSISFCQVVSFYDFLASLCFYWRTAATLASCVASAKEYFKCKTHSKRGIEMMVVMWVWAAGLAVRLSVCCWNLLADLEKGVICNHWANPFHSTAWFCEGKCHNLKRCRVDPSSRNKLQSLEPELSYESVALWRDLTQHSAWLLQLDSWKISSQVLEPSHKLQPPIKHLILVMWPISFSSITLLLHCQLC